MAATNTWASPTVVLAVVLAACGGGSDETSVAGTTLPSASPPVASAPVSAVATVIDHGWIGAFGATMSGTQPLHLVVATIAKYGFLAVYGEDIATDFKARGLLIANESSASNPIRYEGYDPDRQIATIDLTINPKVPAVSGTVTAGSEQKTITGSTIPGYQFDLAASLAAIAGHWELNTSQGRQIALDVDAAGIITGTSGPCSLYESRLVPTTPIDARTPPLIDT